MNFLKLSLIMLYTHMSDTSLNISDQCEMSCLSCNLNHSNSISSESIIGKIKSGRFFSFFHKKKVVNLYGGNPLLNQSFSELICFLNKEKSFIRVWSHLNVSLDYILKINPLVNQWCFYFPYLDSKEYQFYVGRQDFESFDKNLTQLLDEGINLVLHMEVKEDSLAKLPDIVDYVLSKNCELWLHFDKRKFSKSIRNDIYYCARYPKINVISLTFKTGTNSCNVPLKDEFSFETALFYSKLISFIKRLQTKFTIA